MNANGSSPLYREVLPVCAKLWTLSNQKVSVKHWLAAMCPLASAIRARTEHFVVKANGSSCRSRRSWRMRNSSSAMNRSVVARASRTLVEELYRTGGETVHVCSRHPNGVTPKEYRSILQRNSDAARWGWQVMRRNPGVYARGKVSHSDHETITLPFWHRVSMNTETQSRTMARVAFLD
jgi:hypothetical protein